MKVYFTIFIMFFGWEAFSQNSLSGKITDKATKEILIGANLYFPDLKKGTTTDNDGVYTISELPAGKFLLEIRFIGFATQVVKVDIDGETKIDFEMEESHTELNEVVVTGNSVATEKAINPIQTISIDKISLRQSSSVNIIDVVSNKPGISQITTGAGISKPVIRGLGYNRVVVLQNNIRQEGQQWGDEHGTEIDEFSVDRVEIIKGPGSLIYGSDAMAGVINLLAPKPIQQGKITASFLSSYHSNNNLQGYSLQNAGNINGFNWFIQGTGKKAGNYTNAYDGKVLNSGFNEMNLNGSAGINKKWGYSQINFSTFNQDLGLVEGERDSLGNFIRPVAVGDTIVEEETAAGSDLTGYKIFIPRQEINLHRVSATSHFIIGKSRLNFTLGWQQNHRKEFDFQSGADGTIKEGTTLYFLLNTINYDIHFALPELKGWETSLGINGFQQTNTNKGAEFLIPEYAAFDAGIFAVTRKSFGNLNLSGGVRYNIRTVDSKKLLLDANGEPTIQQDSATEEKFTAFKNSFSAFSYSAGLSYRFTEKLIGKFNVSSGFRVPNMAELSSNGHHEGTFRYEIGSPDLKPETSLQLDGGFLFNTKHISLELDAFSNSISNYIFSEKLSSVWGGDSITVDDSDSLTVFKFVRGNANLLGGEITLDIHPHPFDWLHFENSFSYVQGTQAHRPDSTKYLPFMPAPKFQSELRAEFKKAGKVLSNFYVTVEWNYFFRQDKIYSAYGTETATPSYSLLNAGIGTDAVNKNDNTLFSIYFCAANLFDVAYQNHLSRLKYTSENPLTGRKGVFNMGRNFNIKLIVPLVLKK